MNATLPLQNLKPHKLSVDDLLVLDRGGAFAGLPRMELLDGTLYEMSPQTSRHVGARNRLTFRLQSKIVELGLSCEAFSEATIVIGANHAPEPDIIVSDTPGIDGYYPARSILLAVEVAVTSLQADMAYKKALYASAGIAEYWVIDVEAELINQFWTPENEDYRDRRDVAFGGVVHSVSISGLHIESDGLI